jgi:hypothetical protein
MHTEHDEVNNVAIIQVVAAFVANVVDAHPPATDPVSCSQHPRKPTPELIRPRISLDYFPTEDTLRGVRFGLVT